MLPVVVHAIPVNAVGVKPLAVYGCQVVPFEREMISGTTVEGSLPVPMAQHAVLALHTIEVRVLVVMPLWVKAVHVVPGEADPVLAMIVAAVADVVPMAKQTGCAETLGHTSSVRAVTAGVVSFVQVAVEPEIVAVSSTPLDVVPEPMAMQLNVVADVGQSMSVSADTPAGSGLLVHVVPFVDTAAAPPLEL